MPRTTNLNPNLAAWLDTIARSELTAALLLVSDDGYNVWEGSTPDDPVLFNNYATHPGINNPAPHGTSTAAGRYQILHRFAVAYIQQLRLPDFGPESQDAIALQMTHECDPGFRRALAGDFAGLVAACASRWASLPGADYPGQRMQRLADLQGDYVAAGGTVA